MTSPPVPGGKRRRRGCRGAGLRPFGQCRVARGKPSDGRAGCVAALIHFLGLLSVSSEEMYHRFAIPPSYGKNALIPPLAGGLGFEPRQAESESAVLPLDDPP